MLLFTTSYKLRWQLTVDLLADNSSQLQLSFLRCPALVLVARSFNVSAGFCPTGIYKQNCGGLRSYFHKVYSYQNTIQSFLFAMRQQIPAWSFKNILFNLFGAYLFGLAKIDINAGVSDMKRRDGFPPPVRLFSHPILRTSCAGRI